MKILFRHSWVTYCLICTALLLSTVFIACGSSDDSDTPDTPETPVNPEADLHVPVTGGTIMKGDIALTFPSGTYDSDTKVAITEVKKGEIGGENEASPFYQVTLPMSSNKPFSVKMKADKADGNISFVVFSTGYAISGNSEATNESRLETVYNNGEYTATMPAFDRNDSKENTTLIIGLGKLPDYNVAEARMTTRANNSVIGKEGNVNWELDITYGYMDKYSLNYRKLEALLPQVNIYIKESIRTINSLGLHIPDTATLHYHINAPSLIWPESDGYFSASPLSRDFDCINLLDKLVLGSDTKRLKMSILHETFHNFQTYYLPGNWYKPIGSHNTMFESGAVWIEKYMNNGQLNGQWQKEAGLANNILNHFRIGLSRSSTDILGQYVDLSPYAEYGYAQAPLLYYMISKNYSRGYDDTVIASLYDHYWKLISDADYTFVDVLDDWYFGVFSEEFFDGADNINDYYLALWKGEVMSAFSFDNSESVLEDHNMKVDIMNEKNSKFSLDGKVYPFGCEGLLFKMDKTSFKDSLLNENEMVIKQDAEGVKTYLLYTQGPKTYQWPTVAVKGDSIVITGEELEALRKQYGFFSSYFFLLTVREDCSLSETGTIPSKVSVELRQQDTEEISKVIIYPRLALIKDEEEYTPDRNLNMRFEQKYKEVKTSRFGENKKNMHVVCSAYIEWADASYPIENRYAKYNLSFDIEDVDKGIPAGTSKITNVHYECLNEPSDEKRKTSSFNIFTWKMDIPTIPMTDTNYEWSGTRNDGIEFKNFSYLITNYGYGAGTWDERVTLKGSGDDRIRILVTFVNPPK